LETLSGTFFPVAFSNKPRAPSVYFLVSQPDSNLGMILHAGQTHDLFIHVAVVLDTEVLLAGIES
jgi:hypothetical protein